MVRLGCAAATGWCCILRLQEDGQGVWVCETADERKYNRKGRLPR